MKDSIIKLLGLKSPSNYQISKSTNIAQSTLSDYASGKSDVGNMRLDHAIKLNNYYEEMEIMEKLMINESELTNAVKEFNSWSGSAVLFIDFEDGKTWTDVHDIPTYHSSTIYPIVAKDDMLDPNARYGTGRIVRLARLKKEYIDNGESDLLVNSLDVYDIK